MVRPGRADNEPYDYPTSEEVLSAHMQSPHQGLTTPSLRCTSTTPACLAMGCHRCLSKSCQADVQTLPR